MQHYNDFTLDPLRYPREETSALDSWLHATHRRHVYIVDPAIPVADYLPYQTGLNKSVRARFKTGRTTGNQ